MIRVISMPEPADFDNLVRQPGLIFLSSCPNPTTKQFEKHPYWRAIKSELRSSYSHVCAYSCQHIPLVTGNDNVEHFVPKAPNPNQAYEWVNYRLVCGLLNSRKGTRLILDPFIIQDGWFRIQFPSLQIHPDKDLKDSIKDQVNNTIDILKLNHEGDCIPSRRRFIDGYCSGKYGMNHLEEEAPFLAKELIRQGLELSIKTIWTGI